MFEATLLQTSNQRRSSLSRPASRIGGTFGTAEPPLALVFIAGGVDDGGDADVSPP